MDSKNDKDNRKNSFQDFLKKEEVEVVVNRALGPSTRIINHHVRIYSTEKLGFLGDYRNLIVTVQRDGNIEKEICTFFLKTVPYDIEEQASLIEECRAFYKETNFYKLIMPELVHGLKDKSWLAECYLVKNDLLIFEDLKFRNFSIKDVHLDLPVLKSGLTALAKLHASTLLAEKRLGKSLGEIYSDQLQECLFVRDSKFNEWVCTSVNVLVAIAKQLKLDHACISKVCDRIFELIKPSKTRRNVICHGDCKSYNLLFDDSQPIPKCVLVDFQLVRYVPAMADVLQMIYLTTRRKFRDENEKLLLKHYHEVFREFVRDHDEEIDVPIFSDILQEYEEMRAVGLITSALYSPLNLMDKTLCADLTKDSDGFAKLVFETQDDFVLDLMEKDTFYKDVLIEIVNEIVQRSKQFLK